MPKLLLIVAAFLFINPAFSQVAKKDSYVVTIKKGKVEKQNNQTFWLIPATLTNTTNDTLKYFSMSCSWQDFYTVNNKKFKIETAECNKNIPVILMLAPKQSSTAKIRLLIEQALDAPEIKFKIGFNLMKASDNNKPLQFDFKEVQKKRNVIWSNLISM